MNTGIGMAKQILAIQKTVVHNSFKTQALWQEQGERAARALSKAGGWSPGSEHFWDYGSAVVQTGRDAVKALLDAQFAVIDDLLEAQTVE